MIKIIDPHLHFFNLAEGQYHWLQPENPPFWPDKQVLCRNYGASDVTLSGNLTLAGMVHIEAGYDNHAPWREIDWLEKTVEIPLRTVAGVNILDKDFELTLSELQKRRSVIGVRDILDEETETKLSSPCCQKNLAILAEAKLIFEAQLPIANTRFANLLDTTAKAHKRLSFILNHGGWPPLTEQDHTTWLKGLNTVAKNPNIAVKFSGLEMLERDWQWEKALNLLTTLLNTFSPTRVMLASNFPLCTWRLDYADYWQEWSQKLVAEFGLDVAQKLLASNAVNYYQIPISE